MAVNRGTTPEARLGSWPRACRSSCCGTSPRCWAPSPASRSATRAPTGSTPRWAARSWPCCGRAWTRALARTVAVLAAAVALGLVPLVTPGLPVLAASSVALLGLLPCRPRRPDARPDRAAPGRGGPVIWAAVLDRRPRLLPAQAGGPGRAAVGARAAVGGPGGRPAPGRPARRPDRRPGARRGPASSSSTPGSSASPPPSSPSCCERPFLVVVASPPSPPPWCGSSDRRGGRPRTARNAADLRVCAVQAVRPARNAPCVTAQLCHFLDITVG